MSEATAKKEGVDQIIKVLDVVVEGGNVADAVSKQTTVIGKAMAVLPIADELLRLMSLSPMALKRQWKDLDDEEREMLRKHVNEKFDIADDALEAQLETGLDLVGDVIDCVDRAVAYAKSFKKKG